MDRTHRPILNSRTRRPVSSTKRSLDHQNSSASLVMNGSSVRSSSSGVTAMRWSSSADRSVPSRNLGCHALERGPVVRIATSVAAALLALDTRHTAHLVQARTTTKEDPRPAMSRGVFSAERRQSVFVARHAPSVQKIGGNLDGSTPRVRRALYERAKKQRIVM